jgi:hypothetical protein
MIAEATKIVGKSTEKDSIFNVTFAELGGRVAGTFTGGAKAMAL